MNHSPEELLSQEDFVRRMARSLLRDEHAVDDVVQQTWLAMLRSPVERIKDLRAWLGTVARNTSREKVRRSERLRARERSAARSDIVPSAADVAAREETRRHVVEAVLALDEPYQSAILLRFYEDWSASEIATRLEVPLETVRTRVRRGLEKMRRQLDSRHGGDRGAWTLAIAPLAGLAERGAEGAAAAAAHAAAAHTAAPAAATAAAPHGLVAAAVKGAAILVVAGVIAIPAWFLTRTTAEPPPIENQAAAAPARDLAALPEPPETPEDLVPVQPAPADGWFVRGRVVDSEGRPAANARVVLLVEAATEDGGREDSVSETGKTCRVLQNAQCDADGRFEADPGGPEPVFVYLFSSGSPFLDPVRSSPDPLQWKPWQGRWVTPPADSVDFTVNVKPTAKVIVRVEDEKTGEPIYGFECSFWSHETHLVLPGRSDGGVLEQLLPLAGDAEERFVVTLRAPSASEPPFETIALRPGDVRELTLRLDTGKLAPVEGTVTDAAGNPIAGALVFFGNQIRMRGDEPFKPFRPERIADGTLTDENGRFALSGAGRLITAWHSDHSPVTVPAGEAGEIRLPARGAIQGRLCDINGVPQPGVEVALDRARTVLTDSTGRFAFDDVEAGVRGLTTPAGGYFGVDVPPGETVTADIAEFIPEVLIEMRSGGVPYTEPVECVLMGRDRLFSLHFMERGDNVPGDRIRLEAVIPGRYLLITRAGMLATMTVDGRYVVADCGACDLTVHARESTRVYVVPAGSSELAELFGGRFASKRVPASGQVVFDPLPAGAYAVGIDRQGIFATVEVAGRGAQVRIE